MFKRTLGDKIENGSCIKPYAQNICDFIECSFNDKYIVTVMDITKGDYPTVILAMSGRDKPSLSCTLEQTFNEPPKIGEEYYVEVLRNNDYTECDSGHMNVRFQKVL